MTQPATVFATDLWWWIQCKESQNLLGLVCLKMSVFSSLDLSQVFASTNRMKIGLSGDSTHLTSCWRSPIYIGILARSSLCSQHTKSGSKQNQSRAEDIWSSVASKLTMHSDQMTSGFSGSGDTADLVAYRRLPMLGSFTRTYLCSHHNRSTIFHRLCDASIFGEGRMLFLRMGEGFALSGLEQPAWNNSHDWQGIFSVSKTWNVAQVRHVTQIRWQETQCHSGHLMQWSSAQKTETEQTLLVSHLQAFWTTACLPVCVEPQLSFADQTRRRVDMAFFRGGTWQAATIKPSP